jgi:murein L,D-transpeptidase YcbB/YkuD
MVLPGCGIALPPGTRPPELEVMVSAQPLRDVAPEVWSDLRAFYTQRHLAPAWVDHGRPTGRALAAIAVLETAREHGFDPADYGVADLAARHGSFDVTDGALAERRNRLAEFDVRLTAGLLAFGRDVALGRPALGPPLWHPWRTPPDLVAHLLTLAEGDPAGWADAVRPPHPQYAALQRALATLHADKDADRDADEHRIQQVALNMERWRWMPDDLGARHVLVNVPAFRLMARDHGHTVLDLRVIVGKPGQHTPLFRAELASVAFSPYWNIPSSIATAETIPAARRDPSSLAKQNIDILRGSGSGAAVVDPATLDWTDPAALKGLRFRQRPGPGNALGRIKFLFPNPHSVYIHDTPSRTLFNRPVRALSHGCIRVEQPLTLARHVLRDDLAWPEAAIARAMGSGVEKHVRLAQPIPVYIVYFTAWVNEDGVLELPPDIYGYDRREE